MSTSSNNNATTPTTVDDSAVLLSMGDLHDLMVGAMKKYNIYNRHGNVMSEPQVHRFAQQGLLHGEGQTQRLVDVGGRQFITEADAISWVKAYLGRRQAERNGANKNANVAKMIDKI